MRVNSSFKGFFNNRLMVTSGIALMMLLIIFITSSFAPQSDRGLLAKQVNLMIRQLGHQLLLQSGDSTSRVLPVTEIKEGTFLLEFENEFVLNHDSLMKLSQAILPKTKFPSGYTVTVHECLSARIVHGFQVNNSSPDILACQGRSEPPGCYTIEISFPDLYLKVETKNAVQKKIEKKEVDIGPVTEELKTANIEPAESFKVDSQEINPKFKDSKKTAFDYPFITLVGSGMLVLLSVALLIGRFGKTSAPVPVENQDNSVVKEFIPELAALGKFLFDVKHQRLLLGTEVISLTDKECRILELLNENFGDLISRETLMQKVWINEGVITGRSLDMFVSKLRKKLSSDPELRITNVHGKGYKLETIHDPLQ